MRPGACSPSAAMLVRLAILRGVVMNHTLDTFDVDASGSNICRHQCHAVAMDETRHRLVTLVLAKSTMDCSHIQVGSPQLLANPVNSPTCTTENHAASAPLHGITS